MEREGDWKVSQRVSVCFLLSGSGAYGDAVVNVDGQACAYTKELQRTVTHTQIFLLCRTPVATETEAHPLQTLQDLLHRYCCVDGELVGPSWLAARWSHFLGLLVISLYSN